MEIRELQPAEYGAIFDAKAPHIYNTVAFNELNRRKAEAVYYLGFFDGTKPRLGIILGERDGRLLSPFSAPFGGFSQAKPQTAAFIFEAVGLLKEFGAGRNMPIQITLPPPIYSTSLTSLTASALSLHGRLLWSDINYHRELNFDGAPEENHKIKTRESWRMTVKSNLIIDKFEDPDAEKIRRAYTVIKDNHENLGYPLRMALEDVEKTSEVVKAFIFIGRQAGDDVAALIYPTSRQNAQLIYWGDRMAARGQHLMNVFPEEIMSACRDMGFKRFDLGPASSEGIPSAGLCRFKESLGCIATVKPTFEL